MAAGKTYAELYGTRADEIKAKRLRGLLDIRCPNRPEKMLMALVPSNVEFTGDGRFWLILGGHRRKNPDFVVHPFGVTRKVIEVFGEYWHRPEEESALIQAYSQINVKCLVLWAREIKQHPTQVKQKIETFLRICGNSESA